MVQCCASLCCFPLYTCRDKGLLQHAILNFLLSVYVCVLHLCPTSTCQPLAHFFPLPAFYEERWQKWECSKENVTAYNPPGSLAKRFFPSTVYHLFTSTQTKSEVLDTSLPPQSWQLYLGNNISVCQCVFLSYSGELLKLNQTLLQLLFSLHAANIARPINV